VERGEGGALRLKPAGVTRMACPEPVMEQERRYLEPPGPGLYSGSALRTYIMTSTLLGRPIPPNHVS
jgi:META domain